MTPTPLPRAFAVPRSSLAVPAVAAAGGLAFAAWKPGVALSVLASPRALAFSAVVAVLVLALGWGLPRAGARAGLTAAVQAAPVAVAFALTVLPAFVVVTVEEAPPPAAASASAGAPAAPSGSGRADVAGSPLQGIRHRASGRVRVLVAAGGERVVRFEDLDVEPGPDYVVQLVPGAGREDPDGGTPLGRLKGARGDQNYPVPAAARFSGAVTVLVWCRAFSVPVAAATVTWP